MLGFPHLLPDLQSLKAGTPSDVLWRTKGLSSSAEVGKLTFQGFYGGFLLMLKGEARAGLGLSPAGRSRTAPAQGQAINQRLHLHNEFLQNRS